MQKLSLEFKEKSYDMLKKQEELLFILQKEWKALTQRDFDTIWRCSKEKNEIFTELKAIKLKLDKETADFFSSLGLVLSDKTDEKWAKIRKNLVYEEYLVFDSFVSRHNSLNKEIVSMTSHNLNWAREQISNISKLMEIFLPQQENKNFLYSPQLLKQTQSNQKGYIKGV